METKIQIRTPKGQAKGTEKKLRPLILGKAEHQVFVNDDNDTIIWVVNTDVRKALKIQRNVAVFDITIRSIFENRTLQKTLVKKLDEGQREELKEMLLNQTKVEIVKDASVEELAEYGEYKSWWQVIKDKFKRAED